jgi:hypothetical protein
VPATCHTRKAISDVQGVRCRFANNKARKNRNEAAIWQGPDFQHNLVAMGGLEPPTSAL